jgi:hypothetical protein
MSGGNPQLMLEGLKQEPSRPIQMTRFRRTFDAIVTCCIVKVSGDGACFCHVAALSREKTMYHPLLLQPEVLRDLPALVDDSRARADEPAVLSYRSEAFAEDLSSTHEAPPARRAAAPGPERATLLLAVPVGALLAGALLMFGLG